MARTLTTQVPREFAAPAGARRREATDPQKVWTYVVALRQECRRHRLESVRLRQLLGEALADRDALARAISEGGQ